MRIHILKQTPDETIDFARLYSAYQKHGAILLRGGTMNLEKFEAIANYFCDRFHHVGGRSAMRQDQGDGFTTGVWAGNMDKLAHTEGSYRPAIHRPDTAFFCCVVPPSASGGETTLFDGAEMLQHLPKDLARRFREQGIIYEMTWQPERWSAEFDVENEVQLREYLARFPEARYSLENGTLHLFYSAPAIFSVDGVDAFANGILNHLPAIDHPAYAHSTIYTKPSNRVSFGDGEPLSSEVYNQLIDVQDKVIYKHQWQKLDVVIINNLRYMHGRTTTSEECERTLLSRFGKTAQRHRADA
ncbi:hypothetical protein BOV90_01705 [Solemya velum gill symbiont]|uniref:TauD/TfdA-like domain-containing protein n=1 Tax=Solemya velum gill symbiont TaxID=2340 RepID=A0A1T2CN55_SOVGS|nr:TauD/TfdA family dioxygenase [Solemya velum gill symbiont]OOY36277.1 hypothetical protein BOV88_01435 [Solemya velum gill symbiont]OOY40864.1 hypothetical protein BOV90_01705 [Solemya velum gill symbiont]